MRPTRLALFALAAACFARAAGPAVDWEKIAPELLAHYTALLRINTSNPPGNETRAAEYLRQILEREGIATRLYELKPGRGNLVARIRGSGAARPILVMGHTDVVGVQRGRWTLDPFAAIRNGGYIYGRGAQDDKSHVAAGLMLMLLLKRLNVPLTRDVIFLAEAGEEGTTSVGIDFMAAQHWNEIEAEYALAEGGVIAKRDGRVRLVEITTTEKVPRPVRLIAHGTASHGSQPTLDNAVVRLAAAVARVGAWQPAMRLNDVTRQYFSGLARVSSGEQAERYRGISNPARAPEIERFFAEHEPGHYSILRTSVAPTRIQAGFRSNVIPSEAEAYLDIRALPDEDMDRFLADLRRVVGDTKIDVVPLAGGRPASPPSSTGTLMFRALEHAQQRLFPGAITLASMLTGATDMAQLRSRGVQAYGFGPVLDDYDHAQHGPHSDDERLRPEALAGMSRFLWEAVTEVAQP